MRREEEQGRIRYLQRGMRRGGAAVYKTDARPCRNLSIFPMPQLLTFRAAAPILSVATACAARKDTVLHRRTVLWTIIC